MMADELASAFSLLHALPFLLALQGAREEPVHPIPSAPALDPDKVELGRRLFAERRLSSSRRWSCADCHALETAGVDGKSHPFDLGSGRLDTPTIWNSALNFRQFWDGRAMSLEEQLEGPLHATGERALPWSAIVARLRSDPQYVAAFTKVYPEGIHRRTIKDALATFQRSLVTPGSRFDRYLLGDESAITEREKEGYRRFKSLKCITCHNGVNLGGNMFQVFGAFRDFYEERKLHKAADLGIFNRTRNKFDRHKFRVPGLRHTTRTAPYLHDGSVATLEEIVDLMARYQLGREISAEDRARIIEFLGALAP
jgi:cytochrome c peroxidase